MRHVLLWQELRVHRGPAAHPAHVRHGVTLLEVIFSLGIVTVGLLGVMIIVPLAGLRTTQGTIADGADRLGRNAIRAFDVYQMRRQDSWAQLDPGSGNYYPYPYTPLQLNPWPAPYYPDRAMPWECGFCIDPLYMAANAGIAGIQRFPYLPGPPGPGMPWMLRVTLRTSPGATTAAPPAVPAMSLDQAGQIFLGDDDLVFNLPTDRTLPPQQKFGFGGTTGNEGLKRQWEGKFSWLATLVPKPGQSNDTYLLSIVVFHRRELLIDAEHMVDVLAFNGNGYNGGDVELRASSAATPSADEDDLKMKEGDWLMLAGIDDDVTPFRYYFQWYRIQTADAGPREVSPNVYDRDLTLFGADWPGQAWATPAIDYRKAVWIPGIAAVYEKTIRLETSSMWTDL